MNNYRKIKAIEKENRMRWLKVNPELTDESGIYILARQDENGIKYAYIGQAKHILSRLAQHLAGYQHIDLSLKKHGLYSEENNHGWYVSFRLCEESQLDEQEQRFIMAYANAGFQLRNKTAGGQGEGKVQINEFRASKGYRDGVLQGKKALSRELKHIIDKHLTVELKDAKKGNKTSQKAFEKFMALLDESNYERASDEQ